MSGSRSLLDRIAEFIAGKVTAQSSGYEPYTPSDPESLRRALEPGDVLLVEGNQKVSAAIKYLTQSTWSHSALYVGEILHIRHHSLFAPRDFDLSPYFKIVKPTIEFGFDYRKLQLQDPPPGITIRESPAARGVGYSILFPCSTRRW